MYQKILEHLLPHIQRTADFIAKEYISFDPANIEIKGHNDLVSYVDKTAEAMLMEACSQILPGSGFINEETGMHLSDSDFVWIIDPLDGTTNFMQKIPLFAISVALQHQGETVLGVVHEIIRHETFTAIKGKGSFLNNQRIQVTSETQLSQVVIATGFPYSNFYDLESYLLMFKEFLFSTRGLRRLGSAATDLAYTAAGRFGGFFEANLKPWDIAAGILIVQEAGGITTDFFGSHDCVFGNSILASSPIIHQQMMNIIRKNVVI
jgi:myo-inositol-1(or 4)-monophosphatase